MAIIFLSVAVLVAALIAAWNFVPAFREKTKGWSTILEGLLGTALMYFGLITEGIQEAFKDGYLPKELVFLVPGLVCAWIIIKRIQTKTPVGKKP